MNKEEQYRSEVDAWVADLLREEPGTLALPLLQALPCVYPTDVAEALRRLIATPTLAQPCRRLLEELSGQPLPAPADLFQELPIPHALDFEWRFDRPTVRFLSELIGARTTSGSSVLLLGTPTLAVLGPEVFPDRIWRLVESNPLVIEQFRNSEHLTLVHGDAGAEWLDLPSAASVVLDPPWYMAEQINFLATATKALDIGGSVLMSLPPAGVRPGIDTELDRVKNAARGFGLSLELYEHTALGYEGPFFERNALASAGIAGTPWNWRRGDLAVFAKVTSTLISAPMTPIRVEPRWEEVTFGQVRVKVDCSQQQDGEPALIKLVSDDILPSVSRRSPWRARAQVWTSGNRIFGTLNPSALLAILRGLRDRRPLTEISDGTGIKMSDVERTAAQLHALVEAEVTDMRKVGLAYGVVE